LGKVIILDTDIASAFAKIKRLELLTRLFSSIGKAKRILDYEPQTTFEDGLKKVHEWFEANWAVFSGVRNFEERYRKEDILMAFGPRRIRLNLMVQHSILGEEWQTRY
jgi:hypothetical protein